MPAPVSSVTPGARQEEEESGLLAPRVVTPTALRTSGWEEKEVVGEEARLRAEKHKRARLKVEAGVRLALEARRRAEKEEGDARLQAEEEARLVEETRLKAEKEEKEYAWLEAEEEARLVEEARLKAEEEEEDLRLKAEEENRLAEEERLKVEEHESAHIKMDDCGIMRTAHS